MVRGSVTRSDAAQQSANASLQSRVEYYMRVRNRADKRDRADSSGSSGEEGIPTGPEEKCRREEQGVWVFCTVLHKESSWLLNLCSRCSFGFALG